MCYPHCRDRAYSFGDEGKTWELRVSPDMEGNGKSDGLKFFKTMDWWKLESHDELLTCNIPHDHDERNMTRSFAIQSILAP